MHQPRRNHGNALAWVLLVLGIAYSSVFYTPFWSSVTGSNRADGIIGVLLGLLMCSRSAANLVDRLLFDRDVLGQASTMRADLLWLGLRVLLLAAGWAVIVVGSMRLAARPA